MSRLILFLVLLATPADAGSCARRFTGDDACRIYDTHCFAVACYREKPRVRLAANYDRQNEAIKECYETERGAPSAPASIWFRLYGHPGLDPDENAHHQRLMSCMEKAGMHFCPSCPSFGVLMGEYCLAARNGIDRPACWYAADQKPETGSAIMERWKHWVQDLGWLKQSAPYGPDELAAPVIKPSTMVGNDGVVYRMPKGCKQAWEGECLVWEHQRWDGWHYPHPPSCPLNYDPAVDYPIPDYCYVDPRK